MARASTALFPLEITPVAWVITDSLAVAGYSLQGGHTIFGETATEHLFCRVICAKTGIIDSMHFRIDYRLTCPFPNGGIEQVVGNATVKLVRPPELIELPANRVDEVIWAVSSMLEMDDTSLSSWNARSRTDGPRRVASSGDEDESADPQGEDKLSQLRQRAMRAREKVRSALGKSPRDQSPRTSRRPS